MDIAQRLQIRQWIRETLAILGESAIESKLNVEFNNTFTRRLGDASKNNLTGKLTVRFSVPLWPLATEVDRKETVVHEVCHIVDMVRGTYQSSETHGLSWARLMRQCGIAPKRCHSVKRPPELRRTVQRFQAKCACKVHEITSHRRTKMITGSMKYRCLKCGTFITLVG